MRIAVYSLTRDRVEYTQHCFAKLQALAGAPFDHYVVDNGSEDSTPEWLVSEYQARYPNVTLIPNTENLGISVGSNQALDEMVGKDYDLIIKMDNDCEVLYSGILKRVARLYESFSPLSAKYMLSPRVEGINNQPKRARRTMVDDVEIGITGIIGGLFHIMPGDIYQSFRYNPDLPKAQGQDQQVCRWFRRLGGELGYMEQITVAHYETTTGQAARFPEYFERKWEEEKGYNEETA